MVLGCRITQASSSALNTTPIATIFGKDACGQVTTRTRAFCFPRGLLAGASRVGKKDHMDQEKCQPNTCVSLDVFES